MAGPLVLHTAFESLGYLAGALIYALLRKRRGDPVSDLTRVNVLVGAALGAALGSRFLYWLCDPSLTLAHISDVHYLFGGKTIVGGLLGGWAGVEIAKKREGVRTSTGDLFVLPLIVAMSIGRIGCFLAGPIDHTAGLPTSLPWGIAMGDNIRRHPVALYEIAFLLMLIPIVESVRRRGPNGDAFRVLIGSYLLFRFAVDFLKPDPPRLIFGVTAIQIVCVVGVAYVAMLLTTEHRQLTAAASHS